MAGKKRTTIYDIAAALSITPASVSRALKDDPSIGRNTKELVKKTALKMNYRPNSQAHMLSTGKSGTVGVVVPIINDHFFSNIIAGIESVAKQHQYTVLICQSHNDAANEQACIETLIRQNVACIMISLFAGSASAASLKQAAAYSIPIIQFDRTDELFNTMRIVNDNAKAMADLVKHLADQGYKRIAHLAGPQHISIYKQRKQAFEQALKKLKLLLRKEYILFDCLTKEDGKAASKKLLQLKEPPDAIITVADICALGVLETAKQLKIKVPDKLAVSGFSNEPYTELSTPSITSIDQGSFEMGRQVAQAFMETQTKKRKAVHTIMVATKLIPRTSTMRRS